MEREGDGGEGTRVPQDADYVNSAGCTALVATVYAIALHLAEIPDEEDNFFELGGQSLQAIRAARQISERSGRRITIREIFEYPTPGKLGRYLAVSPDATAAAP